MSWNIFDILDTVFGALDLFSSSPSSDLKDDHQLKKVKKTKYIVEKSSVMLLIIALVLLFLVFKDQLPQENYMQTLIIISLIGIVISGLIFFILYHLGLYYFESLYKLLLFSCSVILMVISAILCGYFKSGLFI